MLGTDKEQPSSLKEQPITASQEDKKNMENTEKKIERAPKKAYVVTPPTLPSPAYKQFKSTQPLSSRGVKKKKAPQLYGEMPSMGRNPHHSCHYQHQYYSPPTPPIKRISEYINTPRFHRRPSSPRPGPNQYYPVMELQGPQYSFGQKLGEKDNDGGRTSWEKAWFASNDVWKIKTHYEDKWPEVGSHMVELNCLGKRLPHLPCGPSPSFGMRVPIVGGIPVRGKKHPSPNTYDIAKAERHLFGTQPSYTMVRKDYSWEPWVKNKNVPGPGSYAPNLPAVKPNCPAFSFAKPTTTFATIC